jgi:FkbM family methyltransferase
MGFPIVSQGSVRVKQCKHGDFAYNLNDVVIGRSLDNYGEYAEAELALASQIIRPGTNVVDVGANIGIHSVFYSKLVGDEGKILSFEPSDLNYYFLVTNLTLNNAFNAQHFKAAIGTQRPLYIPINNINDEIDHGNLKTTIKDSGDTLEQCAVFKLDDIGLEHCGLVKVNVSGNEADILQTGESMFSNLRPFIIVNCDGNSKELLQLMKDINYSCYWVPSSYYNSDNNFDNKLDLFDNSFALNVFAYPKELDITIDNLDKVRGINDRWKKTTKKKAKKTTKKKAKKKAKKTKSSSKP